MTVQSCKFSLEQVVKIVKKQQPGTGYAWVDYRMNPTIGREGVVREFREHEGQVVVKVMTFAHGIFWYLEDCLEFVEFPENFAYRTFPETVFNFETAGPDHILAGGDRVNFGTEAYDVWADVVGLTGRTVKDVCCKSAERRTGAVIKHVLQAKRSTDADNHWLYYTPCGQYANGTEVFIHGQGWKFADLDGQDVPPYVHGTEMLLHRKPEKPTIAYKAWVPEAPGVVRPAGLERRKKFEGNLWKPSGVVGLPVEQTDIDRYEYRIPK